MTSSIHGHEVMRIIASANPPLTRAGLAAEVARRFGTTVRFHACADQDMTLAELLEFLRVRGKVAEIAGQLRTDLGQMCSQEPKGKKGSELH